MGLNYLHAATTPIVVTTKGLELHQYMSSKKVPQVVEDFLQDTSRSEAQFPNLNKDERYLNCLFHLVIVFIINADWQYMYFCLQSQFYINHIMILLQKREF